MVCVCGHSGFHHAGLEGDCLMEGCQCPGYWEKLAPDSDEDGEIEEDAIGEYDWELEHNAEEE